jgi:hypothetical protein
MERWGYIGAWLGQGFGDCQWVHFSICQALCSLYHILPVTASVTCIRSLHPLLVHAGVAASGTGARVASGAGAGGGGSVAAAAPSPFPTNTARAALGALATAEDVQTIDAHLHELQAAVATWRHASVGRYVPFGPLSLQSPPPPMLATATRRALVVALSSMFKPRCWSLLLS